MTAVTFPLRLPRLAFAICGWRWQNDMHEVKYSVCLVIIFFILMILVKNSISLLQGEIRFWSLLQVEGLRRVYEFWLRKFSSLVPRPSMANRF